MPENQSIADILASRFGPGDSIITGMAPGRVNLMGEHTDYNEGYVLPMTIGFHIEMAGRLRSDSLVRIYSADYDQSVTFSVEHPLEYDTGHRWSNYPKGVLWALQQAGLDLRGLDLAFRGDLPQGAGLSSSAALEIVTALIALKLHRRTWETSKIALLCQKAENEFIGMKCGVMDQFASLAGSEGHALFLDCRTLQYERVPLNLGDYRILICHSGVKHELVTSEYNQRRQDCSNGVALLKKYYPEVKALRDVNVGMLEAHRLEMTSEVFRRCLHIVTENQRVLESIQAMRQGQLQRFGELMIQSHKSQRDLFEVSCPEIDLLTELAGKVDGVLGSRLTGGGFGGSTVNLIRSDAIGQFETEVAVAYRKQTGIEPRIYICTPCAGATIKEKL